MVLYVLDDDEFDDEVYHNKSNNDKGISYASANVYIQFCGCEKRKETLVWFGLD